MTPLDCALQRGFRSTAKYLQLHGGIPATRLGDPKNQPVNAAMNLKIRDDITLWGGSSSDSERENGEVGHSGRKMLRKKLSYKYGRRKLSLSGSDGDSAKQKTNITEKSKEKSSSRTGEKKSSSKQENVSTSVRSSSKKMSSSRLDYTNEIIINGKTQINIRQTEEIVIDKDRETAEVTEQRAVSTKMTERDRRPRSAKYSRLRDKSAKQAANQESRRSFDETSSPETIIQHEESRKLSLKDQSTNTSQETMETVIENKKFAAVQTTISEEEAATVGKNQQETATLDQQSLMSYTSEDMEDQKKELIVEASVHSPPKHVETTVVQQQAIQDTPKRENVLGENATDANSKGGLSEQHEEQDKSNETQQLHQSGEQVPTEVEANILADTSEVLNEDSTSPIKLEKEEVKPETNENINDNENETIDTNVAEQVQIQRNDGTDSKQTEDAAADDVNEHKSENPVTGDLEKKDVIVEGNEQVHLEENGSSSKLEDNTLGVEEKLDVTVDDKQVENTEDPEKTSIDEANVPVDEKEVVMREGAQDDFGETKMTGADKPSEIVEPKDSLVLDSAKIIDVVEVSGKEDTKKIRKRRKIPKNDDTVTDQQQQSSSLSDEGVLTASKRTHKSFRILDEKEATQLEKSTVKRQRPRKSPTTEGKSRPRKPKTVVDENEKTRRSKIPTPLFKSTLSKSDKHLNETNRDNNLDHRVPSLPNISDVRHHLDEPTRCESNMSAPLLKSIYSDNERDSFSEGEESRKVTKTRRRVKKRSRTRESKSAGSDYESSNLIDSGFEPSPRSTRIPRWKNMSERGVNMTSVTQNIQNNIRRYHLERKIFQQLLELKRHQIRAGQHNEAILVKRAIDTYHQSCASTVGVGRYVAEDYTFKSFEKFLYEALRKLQKNGAEYMRGLPATQSNPLLCTRSTNKCMHAVHAYTGVPCAAYLPRMDHHSIPKIGFNSVNCKPGTGFLPTINPKKAVTLELSHGTDKQVISLPTDRLDQNKRYYVTFTVKGHDAPPSEKDYSNNIIAHTHSKSD